MELLAQGGHSRTSDMNKYKNYGNRHGRFLDGGDADDNNCCENLCSLELVLKKCEVWVPTYAAIFESDTQSSSQWHNLVLMTCGLPGSVTLVK